MKNAANALKKKKTRITIAVIGLIVLTLIICIVAYNHWDFILEKRIESLLEVDNTNNIKEANRIANNLDHRSDLYIYMDARLGEYYGPWEDSIASYFSLGNYRDSSERAEKLSYKYIESLKNGNYQDYQALECIEFLNEIANHYPNDSKLLTDIAELRYNMPYDSALNIYNNFVNGNTRGIIDPGASELDYLSLGAENLGIDTYLEPENWISSTSFPDEKYEELAIMITNAYISEKKQIAVEAAQEEEIAFKKQLVGKWIDEDGRDALDVSDTFSVTLLGEMALYGTSGTISTYEDEYIFTYGTYSIYDEVPLWVISLPDYDTLVLTHGDEEQRFTRKPTAPTSGGLSMNEIINNIEGTWLCRTPDGGEGKIRFLEDGVYDETTSIGLVNTGTYYFEDDVLYIRVKTAIGTLETECSVIMDSKDSMWLTFEGMEAINYKRKNS
jgi:hypothetical protein